MEKHFTDFTIEGDTQVYSLCFNFNELVDAEVVTGLNLMQPLASRRTMTAGQVRGLLYALLKTAHPQVLLTEAGDLLSQDTETVTNAIAEALGVSAPEPEIELATASD